MDDISERKVTNLFNRDQVLSKIDDLLQIKNATEKTGRTNEFIEDRLKHLTESAVPANFSLISSSRKGFLHPDSGIRRNFMVDPFHVDDPQIYNQLVDTIGEIKEHPNWEGKTLREIAPYAILRTIGNYFGNHWSTESTENNNQVFYLDRSGVDSEDIHLSELKGRGFAVCAEKAAVAQNLLSFIGYESDLVASTTCRLNSPENDDQSGHMYNVITSGDRYFIFDPANPILITKDDGGGVHTSMPATYPIDQEGYKRLMSGGQVEVTHNDARLDGMQSIKGPDQKRIYGGPRQAS